jgi:hypothetical protein
MTPRNAFSLSLRRNFLGTLAKTMHLNTQNWRRRAPTTKECEWNAAGKIYRATVCTIAQVHNRADSARPHEVWDGHVVKHRRCIVTDCALGSFGLAEHVVGIGG